MPWSGSDERDCGTSDRDAREHPPGEVEAGGLPGTEDSSLEALVACLEADPEEYQRALEGLEALETATRLRIIEGLRGVPPGPGVVNLLRLLSDSDDESTREFAREALEEIRPPENKVQGVSRSGCELILRSSPSRELGPPGDRDLPRPIRCAVTSVDGSGRGTIVLSSAMGRERRTAAFLCDLMCGIIDALGTVEEESADAGGLVVEAVSRPGVDAIEAPPELASGLLAGCLTLNASATSDGVQYWLEATLGGGFRAHPFTGLDGEPAVDEEPDLLERAGKLLDACPGWLDDSPLTIELAEEIQLRECRITASPERDAGAFRYLFEHRIMHRLELYRRMLLWMAWFWTWAADHELAASARIMGSQLADEQYAVPSHPFATVLMARSLEAAQRRLAEGSLARNSGLPPGAAAP